MATLADDLTSDLSFFFNEDEFGVPATFGAASITVIFDAAFLSAMGMGGTGPQAMCKTSDVAAAVQGDSITINGTAYTIAGPPEPNGTGVTLLQLRTAS